VCVAEGREFVGRTAEIERTGRIEIRHQDPFARAQDFCCLAHEPHAGHDERLCFMVAPEACHFQRIRHATARFIGEGLQLGVDVVMRNEHGLLSYEQFANACFERAAFLRGRRRRHFRPCMSHAARGTRRAFDARFVELDGLDRRFHSHLLTLPARYAKAVGLMCAPELQKTTPRQCGVFSDVSKF
jgi:hypothetical protein